MRRELQGRSGFTLIELMVVIAVIGITLSVVGPRLAGRMEGAALDSTGHVLQVLARSARAHAVLSGQAVDLQLGRSGQVAKLVGGHGEDQASESKDLTPPHRFVEGVRVGFRPEGDAAQAANRIRFRPDGSADSGQIVLRDAKGGVMQLRVEGPVGRISLVRP